MAKDKIQDLRHHLFQALERLNDDDVVKTEAELSKEVDRAKAISGLAHQVIETAKVEINYLEALNNVGSTMATPGFLGIDAAKQSEALSETKTVIAKALRQNLILEKIKASISMNNTNLDKVGKAIDMTAAQISQLLSNGDMPVWKIEEIAKKLNINKDFLFDYDNKNLLE